MYEEVDSDLIPGRSCGVIAAVPDNDSLMRSLPELSKETGIPMPVILRLTRQHPNVIPSLGSGSQRSFPHGVVPTLLALYQEMGTSGGTDHRHAALITIGRRMRERRVAAEVETEEVSKRTAALLALRLAELEGRQRKISKQLHELLEYLRDSPIQRGVESRLAPRS
jgi:hypothetical protein